MQTFALECMVKASHLEPETYVTDLCPSTSKATVAALCSDGIAKLYDASDLTLRAILDPSVGARKPFVGGCFVGNSEATLEGRRPCKCRHLCWVLT